MAFTLPADYGYVLATATASVFVNQWYAIRTAQFRKQAQVPYPNSYATAAEMKDNKDKYLFNCAQRAHANFSEHWPAFLVGLVGGGLQYPLLSAGMGGVWLAARIMYNIGYTRADKEKGSGRNPAGSIAYLPELGLHILTGMTAYSMIMG
ncbi:MAG: hypothetical protein OHK93_008197 [Ramalina farinacea]|uniref:Microsomal glutathione S-transferase 3 n=1 Tax=Ramalina farinacea TaxID=258253 RepID=A0AA43QLZ8_9LECA|nr:hypothetical protein [Ramalina farinacea]